MVKRYPFLEAAAKYGRRFAAVLGVLTVIAAASLWLAGTPVMWAVVLLLAAPLVFVGLRMAAELIEVLADTLMPR